MKRNVIADRTMTLLKDILNKEDIQLNTPLLGRGGVMDSVTVLRLIDQIEREFNLHFDEDDLELESLADAGAVVELIMRRSSN